MTKSKDLTTKAMLGTLTMSGIGNSKVDTELTDMVSNEYGVEAGSMRLSKKLYGEYVTPYNNATAAIRKYMKEKTQPWSGKQVIIPIRDASNPNRLYFKEFEEGLRALKDTRDKCIEEFMHKYESGEVQADAQKRLGATVYRDDDYPTPEKMKEKFKFTWEVSEVPSGDFRVGIGAEYEEELRKRVQAQNEAHLGELSTRILYGARELVEMLLESLSNTDKPTKAEAIKKVQSMLQDYRAFPTTDDAEVILDSINASLGAFSAEAIATNPSVKEYVTKKLAKSAEVVGMVVKDAPAPEIPLENLTPEILDAPEIPLENPEEVLARLEANMDGVL